MLSCEPLQEIVLLTATRMKMSLESNGAGGHRKDHQRKGELIRVRITKKNNTDEHYSKTLRATGTAQREGSLSVPRSCREFTSQGKGLAKVHAHHQRASHEGDSFWTIHGRAHGDRWCWGKSPGDGQKVPHLQTRCNGSARCQTRRWLRADA